MARRPKRGSPTSRGRASKGKDKQKDTSGGDSPKQLRIVGGRLRGRPLAYHGQAHTRPMKERVREAIFNLLGPSVEGKHAIDLFAGTGALGLEAISRGALRATFVERHFPTAAVIRQNIAHLDLQSICTVVASDVFFWVRRQLPAVDPWARVIFCCPPFDFFVDRLDDMLDCIERLQASAPPQSWLVVESDERLDATRLPGEAWDHRRYAPAVVHLWRRETIAR